MVFSGIEQAIQRIEGDIYNRLRDAHFMVDKDSDDIFYHSLDKLKTIMSTIGYIHHIEKELELDFAFTTESAGRYETIRDCMIMYVMFNITNDVGPIWHFTNPKGFENFLVWFKANYGVNGRIVLSVCDPSRPIDVDNAAMLNISELISMEKNEN